MSYAVCRAENIALTWFSLSAKTAWVLSSPVPRNWKWKNTDLAAAAQKWGFQEDKEVQRFSRADVKQYPFTAHYLHIDSETSYVSQKISVSKNGCTMPLHHLFKALFQSCNAIIIEWMYVCVCVCVCFFPGKILGSVAPNHYLEFRQSLSRARINLSPGEWVEHISITSLLIFPCANPLCARGVFMWMPQKEGLPAAHTCTHSQQTHTQTRMDTLIYLCLQTPIGTDLQKKSHIGIFSCFRSPTYTITQDPITYTQPDPDTPSPPPYQTHTVSFFFSLLYTHTHFTFSLSHTHTHTHCTCSVCAALLHSASGPG